MRPAGDEAGSKRRVRSILAACAALCFAVTMQACSDRTNAISSSALELDHGEFSPVALRSETLSSAPILGRPRLVALSGRLLWVADQAGNPFLHVLDASSGNLVRSLGLRGQGPRDFTMILNLFPNARGDSLAWVYDAARVLKSVSAAADISTERPYEPQVVQLPSRTFNRVFPLGDNSFLTFALRDTATFMVLDSSGKVVLSSNVPFPGPDSASYVERRKALNGAFVCSRRDGRGFALVHANFGRIDLYDSTLAQTGRADVPFGSQPEFVKDAATGTLMFHRKRDFYFGCAYSREHLFAVFSGRLLAPEQQEPMEGGAYLHVFDLEGARTNVFELGAMVGLSDVDAEERWFYAGAIEAPLILRFQLPRM
jgi:hypothetical protein